jgi:hypothetical protein
VSRKRLSIAFSAPFRNRAAGVSSQRQPPIGVSSPGAKVIVPGVMVPRVVVPGVMTRRVWPSAGCWHRCPFRPRLPRPPPRSPTISAPQQPAYPQGDGSASAATREVAGSCPDPGCPALSAPSAPIAGPRAAAGAPSAAEIRSCLHRADSRPSPLRAREPKSSSRRAAPIRRPSLRRCARHASADSRPSGRRDRDCPQASRRRGAGSAIVLRPPARVRPRAWMRGGGKGRATDVQPQARQEWAPRSRIGGLIIPAMVNMNTRST